MIQRTVQIPTPSGTIQTFVAHPGDGAPRPAVVLYMDMWGIRDALLDIARRVASAGYYCLLPDLYYRGGRVRYSSFDRGNRKLSFVELEPDRQTALLAAMKGLSDKMVIDDTAALFEFIRHGEPVRPGAMGAVGFCMGGRHALCVAGAFPDRIKAAGCLHGTDLVQARADSPHLLARNADGEIYCGHAERDRYAPPDVVPRLQEAFAGCRVRYQFELHEGAQHGYAMPDRDVYDERAAGRDWQNIRTMFKRQLPQ